MGLAECSFPSPTERRCGGLIAAYTDQDSRGGDVAGAQFNGLAENPAENPETHPLVENLATEKAFLGTLRNSIFQISVELACSFLWQFAGNRISEISTDLRNSYFS